MRYNRIGKDLNISDADVEKNLIFGDAKIPACRKCPIYQYW
jgi:hypothetical protein